jgi:hypothetical protein
VCGVCNVLEHGGVEDLEEEEEVVVGWVEKEEVVV